MCALHHALDIVEEELMSEVMSVLVQGGAVIPGDGCMVKTLTASDFISNSSLGLGYSFCQLSQSFPPSCHRPQT